MAVLSYALIFSTYICSVLMYFLPSVFTYKQFAIAVAGASAIALPISMYKKHWCISKQNFITSFLMILIVCLYWMTPYLVNPRSLSYLEVYESFALAITGQFLPTILIALLVSGNSKAIKKMKQMAPILGMTFTFVAVAAAFKPDMTTSGGFAETTYGLNYQTISYMASYAASLLEYYVLTRENEITLIKFRPKYMGVLAEMLILLNALIVLVGGGRGGFVSYTVFMGLTLFLAVKKSVISVQDVIKALFIMAVLIISAIAIFNYAGSLSTSSNGFARITDFLSGHGDSGREKLFKKAIELFEDKPILGNGLGSILLINGIYSHNMIGDLLAETGIVGTAIVIFLIVLAIKKEFALIRQNFTDCLWLYLFLSGFIMSMFSGYYLTHFALWWTMIFVIHYNKTTNPNDVYVRN